MTDQELLATIKADATLRALADTGSDSDIANAISAKQPAPVPISSAALLKAAPATLSAIAGMPPDIAKLEPIAARVREGDAASIGAWAETLNAIGKTCPDSELPAVQALVAAAIPVSVVDQPQVSRVLLAIRPEGRALPIDWSKV